MSSKASPFLKRRMRNCRISNSSARTGPAPDVEGLAQKAGVPPGLLPRLGLDAGAEVMVGSTSDETGYYVDDDGPGLDGTPEEIARLFSSAPAGLVEVAAVTDARRPRQRLARRRWRRAGVGGLASSPPATGASNFAPNATAARLWRVSAGQSPGRHPVAISFGPALLRDDDDDASPGRTARSGWRRARSRRQDLAMVVRRSAFP